MAVARGPLPNSVAVLYFANESRDTADQYLADGVTEEIATSLGRVARLHVVSPAAVRRAVQSSGDDLARVARTLGVRHLVEGSVRRAGGQARITARLLGPDARTALWTDAYTRPTADLLGLEEEIARRVASGVVGTLLPDERRSLSAARVDPVAHDHVLRGNFQLARRSEPTIRRAIAQYDSALTQDSSYAQAWARLALGQALLRFWSGMADRHTPAAESMQVRGEAAAARALALDSSSADTWLALGYLRLYRDPIGMRGVLTAFRRAVLLEPNSGEAHHQLGTGYFWHLDTTRARVEMLRALELDPGRVVTYDNLASMAVIERRYQEAVLWTDSVIATDANQGYAYPIRATAFAALGDSASAMQAVEAAERVGDVPQLHFPRCVVLGMLHSPAARAECTRALGRATSAMDSCNAYAGAGDTDAAIAAFRSAVAAGTVNIRVIQAEPYFDQLRADPRFQQLVAQLRPVEDEP